MPPKKTPTAPKQKLIISRQGRELLVGQDVLTVIDNIDRIIPKEQQSYSINGEKSIDQKKTLQTMADRLRNGVLRTTYLYSKSSATHGRQYAKGSISVQSLSRVLRHTLCQNTYRDYDIVNCHPTIALQYCIKRGWDVPYLSAYVNDRAKHLEKLMERNNATKDDIKTMILAVLNGGRKLYYETNEKTTWIQGLFTEVNDVFMRMMDEPDNAGLIEEVKRIKGADVKPHELRRSVCNRVWVNIENDILNACMDWCEENGLSTEFAVLMFDGFMLPKSVIMPDDWAEKLSDFVYTKTGFRMSFVEKIMDEGIDLSQFSPKTIYAEPVGEVDEGTIIEFIMMPTDATLAEVCRQAFGNKYKYDGSTHYVFRNHRWSDRGMDYLYEDAKSLTRLIKPLTESPEFADKEDQKKIAYALKYISIQKNIKNMLPFMNPCIMDVEFPSKLDSNKDILGFANGVYDFSTNTFRDGKPEDMVSLGMGYDYVKVNDVSKAEGFLKDLVDEATYPCLLGLLAGVLRGGNTEQKFNFFVGSGGNGKSLLNNAMENMLGDYYVGVNKELYTKEKKHAGGGEPEIVKMKGARMGVVAESDDGDVFLTSVFKRTSGGDSISARLNYSNTIVKFQPIYKPFLNTNCLPKFSSPLDDGTARRILIIMFIYKFVDKPMNDIDENGVEIIIEKKRDYTLEKTVKTPEFRNQLLNLLLNADTKYTESPSMVSARENYLKDLNPVAEWFYDYVAQPKPEEGKEGKQQYYRSGSEKDKVSTADLLTAFHKWNAGLPMEQRRKTMTPTSFGKALGQIVKVKQVKIDTKTFSGVVGFVKIDKPDNGYDSDA